MVNADAFAGVRLRKVLASEQKIVAAFSAIDDQPYLLFAREDNPAAARLHRNALFIGSQYAANNETGLREHGITHVFTMCHEKQPKQFSVMTAPPPRTAPCTAASALLPALLASCSALLRLSPLTLLRLCCVVLCVAVVCFDRGYRIIPFRCLIRCAKTSAKSYRPFCS
jgi:hypothetical protein